MWEISEGSARFRWGEGLYASSLIIFLLHFKPGWRHKRGQSVSAHGRNELRKCEDTRLYVRGEKMKGKIDVGKRGKKKKGKKSVR